MPQLWIPFPQSERMKQGEWLSNPSTYKAITLIYSRIAQSVEHVAVYMTLLIFMKKILTIILDGFGLKED